MDQNLSVETLNYQLSTGNKIDVAICYDMAQLLGLNDWHSVERMLCLRVMLSSHFLNAFPDDNDGIKISAYASFLIPDGTLGLQ